MNKIKKSLMLTFLLLGLVSSSFGMFSLRSLCKQAYQRMCGKVWDFCKLSDGPVRHRVMGRPRARRVEEARPVLREGYVRSDTPGIASSYGVL